MATSAEQIGGYTQPTRTNYYETCANQASSSPLALLSKAILQLGLAEDSFDSKDHIGHAEFKVQHPCIEFWSYDANDEVINYPFVIVLDSGSTYAQLKGEPKQRFLITQTTNLNELVKWADSLITQ